MSGFPEPREFQRGAHDALRAGLAAGHKRQILAAPTGSGKTYMAMRLISEALAKGRRALFVADRITLIDQTSKTASQYGLDDHGVIQAQHWRSFPHRPLQIASTQTLARRQWPIADVIVIDECHTQYSSWTDHVSSCDTPVIGLSATPFSKGLGKIFSNVVNAETLGNLTEAGILKRLRVVTAHRPDMTGVAKVAGEWTAEGAGKAALTIAGDAVKEWQDRASDRKTIMFCPDIKTCEEMQQKFRDSGVLAETFTEKTKPEQRDKILQEYRRADSAIRILISVEALAKGFDVPDVSCVIDMRPLRKSFSSWVQMVGRGLRQSTGIDDCLLLDHSGNALRFAHDFEDLYHHGVRSLDDGEKLDASAREIAEKLERGCPACGSVPFVKQCMCCGYVTPPKPSVEIAPANMVDFDIIGAGDKRALYIEVASYVKSSPYYAGEEAGRKKAAAVYKSMTGAWPPWKWNDDLWPLVGVGECSTKTARKIRASMMEYAKRRAAA